MAKKEMVELVSEITYGSGVNNHGKKSCGTKKRMAPIVVLSAKAPAIPTNDANFALRGSILPKNSPTRADADALHPIGNMKQNELMDW
mmetsp:Transcript_18238/g.32939  ORF Transcript_18238/g.32939 Transcript_18238/m.32939 type:complete len:88 (-) Transcript_18238:515-778(-)|eukprot:CAMPEP_0201629412 /NCGR_PEP_ID=MMETSP0493-20130528/4089_1 /ASSEMBLY_ACC=CAM_ASM_000838 /TAXON_ID=420259 /ORGANISM="Thalassiosira gravida, Strain GMp14c1" /LENGTH=87 /DNA_ID=CAMNT_0048100413 /DNA_START=369 /DNA_END=632 /DNA_ORIENTATION=-